MSRPQRQIVYFATAMSLVNLGDSLFYVIVPTYYTHLGLIPFQVGILLSVNRWVRLATNHLAEYGYRRYPSDLWLLGAFFTGAVVSTIYGLATTFFLFLLARIAWGIAYSFLRQAGVMHVVACSAENALTEQMGYFTGINALWRTSGLFLGGLCHDHFGFTMTFVGVGILSLLALPLNRIARKQAAMPDREARAVKESGRNGALVCFGISMGLVGGGMIISTLGLVLKTRVGESFHLAGFLVGVATLTGFVMAVRHLIDGVGGPVLGALVDRIGWRRSTAGLFLLGSILLLMTGLQENVVGLVVVIMLYFICATALYTALYAQSGQNGPRSVAAFATAIDFGMSVGPLIGWGIAQLMLPLSTIFFTGSAVYAVGAVVAFKSLSRSSLPLSMGPR